MWHTGLMATLEPVGIHGKHISLLNGYLKHRVLRAAFNGIGSCAKSIKAGVPEISILGPILFIMFIEDIQK